MANTAIPVFQLYKGAREKANVDPQAKPLALTATKPTAFAHLPELTARRLAKKTLWGLVPADFSQRTGVGLSAWLEAIESNAGRDAYLIDANPAEGAIFANCASRLLVEIPQLVQHLPVLFQAAGFEGRQANVLAPSATFSMAPFMVATQEFWSHYWAFAGHAIAGLQETLSAKEKKWLMAPLPTEGSVLGGECPATYLTGALLGLFLASDQGQKFKALKISIPAKEAGLNSHLKSMRQLKDAAAKAKSEWLASCWLNYRNLYVYQVNGKQWCEQHLAAVTPRTIQFL